MYIIANIKLSQLLNIKLNSQGYLYYSIICNSVMYDALYSYNPQNKLAIVNKTKLNWNHRNISSATYYKQES